MRTCAGTLGLGALCMIVMAAVVGITLTPALEDIKAAGLFTSLVCLAGPPALVIGIATAGILQNEPKQATGGCFSTLAIMMVGLVVLGIGLVCVMWTGG